MVENVEPSANVVTDAYHAYIGLDKKGFEHTRVKHTENSFITEGDKHTNCIEGFWSQLKRGINGIYHQVSPKHLHRYCHEFGYKYNTRKTSDIDRFETSIERVNGKRLTYANLIS